MRFISRIFSVKNLFLLGSIFLLVPTFWQIKEINFDFNKLVAHTGVIQEKNIVTLSDENKSWQSLRIMLAGDSSVYIASMDAYYINSNITEGDTVKFYTKPMSSFGNIISSGGSIWTSHNPNKIFHFTKSNGEVLLNFEEHRKMLLHSIWIFPFFSLAFFGVYLYKRSGIKSPFVIERADFS